jgi:acyl-coenzyme A thioesterase PaaI-like protein
MQTRGYVLDLLALRLLLLPLLLLVAACSQAPTVTSEQAPEFAEEGLHPVSSSGFGSAYVRPGSDLAGYRSVHIGQLQLDRIEIPSTAVAGTLRRDWQMDSERAGALQSVWDSAMRRAFSAYTQVGAEQPGLRVDAEITRVAPGRPTATTIGGGVQPVGSSQDVVEVYVEFRLYNQESGDLLAVIRDSRTMLSVAMSRTAPAAIQTLFNSWAALLHTRISGR